MEYRLQEAIEFVPPTLEVLSEPSSAHLLGSASSAGSGHATMPAASDDIQLIPELLIDPSAAMAAHELVGNVSYHADSLARRPEDAGNRNSDRPGLQRAVSSDRQTAKSWPLQASGMAATPGSQVKVHRKVQQNSLAELAKIVIGGFVGITIACAVLLWVFKVDPFKVAKRLPTFLVPEQMRSNDTSAADKSGDNTSTPQTAESVSRPMRVDPFADNLSTNRSAEKTTPPSLAAAPISNSQPPAQGPKNAVTYSMTDVTAALADAQEAAAAYSTTASADQTDEVELNKSQKHLHATLAKLAETITLMRGEAGDQPAARSAAAEILLNLFNDRAKLDALGRWAAADLIAPMRTSNGIGLAGVVEEVRSLGEQYRTFIRLPGNDSPISVITAEKPKITAGDTTILLGLIVDDPGQNLLGYDGPDETVIWGTIVVKAATSL
jgi:hypothetical protein